VTDENIFRRDIDPVTFNMCLVQRVATIDDEGVTTSILVRFADEGHDDQYAMILHPATALLLGVELVQAGVEG
jgi:hypothetical protein